jgi:hypothetical protein
MIPMIPPPPTALIVDGHPLTLTDLVRHARVTGGREFIDRVIDNHLIWREVERRGVEVDEQDIVETLERTFPDHDPATHGATARAEVRKTIAFGKLKGEVSDELLGEPGRALLARVDRPARRVIRDAMFLFWLREARAEAAIEDDLDRLLGIERELEP